MRVKIYFSNGEVEELDFEDIANSWTILSQFNNNHPFASFRVKDPSGKMVIYTLNKSHVTKIEIEEENEHAGT